MRRETELALLSAALQAALEIAEERGEKLAVMEILRLKVSVGRELWALETERLEQGAFPWRRALERERRAREGGT